MSRGRTRVLAHSHDRQVDRLPAETGYTGIGKGLPGDVPGRVEIGVDLIAARQAQEKRPCRSVAPVHRSAPRTPLAGMPGIDGFNAGANLFGLVGREGSKLGVAPAVMPPPLASPLLPGAAADVGQVLEHNHAARLRALNDASTQNVVAIPPKPCLPPGHRPEMALGRPAAFGLKTATKPEVPLFNLLPAPLSQELTAGQSGGSVDAEIDPEGPTGGGDLRRVDGQDDVEPPARGAPDQVSTVEACRPVQPPPGLSMDPEREFDPARYGGQADNTVPGFQAVGTGIVADAGPLRLRSRDFPPRLLQRSRGPDGVTCLHPGRDHQLAREVRMLSPKFVVCRPVQCYAVCFPMLPAQCSDRVKAVLRSGKRLGQDFILLGKRRQTYADRALHISYMLRGLSARNCPFWGILFPMPPQGGSL